jgi:integrase
MLTERGKVSFVYQCRIGGQSRRFTFKGRDVGEARRWAATLALKFEAGTLAPTPPPQPSYDEKTLRRVVHEYLRHKGSGLRSRDDFLARFENHVFPTLGSRPIETLTRSITVPLVDALALKHRHAAHAVARDLNIIGRWYSARTDAFTWPMVPSPLNPEDRAGRERILEDRELRALWPAAERQGHPHGTLVRFLLLTGLRRTEAAELRRSEVVEGVIRLAPERTKNKTSFVLPLSKAAAGLLGECPEGLWFFPGPRDGEPFSAFTHGKAELDRLAPDVGPWVLHDLRRTAATLMERVGVLPHVIEATLNHKVRGVAGVYRRHNFIEEKRDALERLATELARIVRE